MAMDYGWLGPHFDPRRTQDRHGDISVLADNFINMTIQKGHTHLEQITAIASSAPKPIPIKFISEKLNEYRPPRGCTYFAYACDVIRQIMYNYPTLRWWMEAEGLVIDELASELGPISDFDRLAGALVTEHWDQSGLSNASLILIAKQLDAAGFGLSDHLQPAQWQPILEYNQKYSRKAIRTFCAAAESARFARNIRRRLYVARTRYAKALKPVQPIYVGALRCPSESYGQLSRASASRAKSKR